MGRTHIPFNLLLGHQCRHGVDYHDVNRAGAHQSFAHLQRLFSGIRLRHQ